MNSPSDVGSPDWSCRIAVPSEEDLKISLKKPSRYSGMNIIEKVLIGDGKCHVTNM